MEIVPLGGPNAAAAVALWHEAGLTRPWNDPVADFVRAVAGPSSVVLGAWRDGALAGTAWSATTGTAAGCTTSRSRGRPAARGSAAG